MQAKVPHLRWSQAPPLPWRRPGSADIHIYVYIYVNIYVHIYIYIDIYACIHTYVHTYIHINIHLHTFIYIDIYIDIYIYIYIYIHLYTYKYLFTYITYIYLKVCQVHISNPDPKTRIWRSQVLYARPKETGIHSSRCRATRLGRGGSAKQRHKQRWAARKWTLDICQKLRFHHR